MQSNQFGSQQILSALDALGDLEGEFASVVVHAAHSPFALRVHTVFMDFEPFEACNLLSQGIVDSCKVGNRRTKMARINGVALVAGFSTVKRVMPFGHHSISGSCIDDLFGNFH